MRLFGNISLAKIRFESDNPARRFIEKAEQSLNRATGLTNQLQTFAKGGVPATEAGEALLGGGRKGEQVKKTEISRRMRILLMDDEEMVREVVPEMLGVCGFDVETANDGGEALEKYRQAMGSGNRFDGVVMDLTVPGGRGGKEAVGKLREIDPGAMAIVSSGYAEDPIMSGYREYGFQGVIAKPFKIEKLRRELQRVFDIETVEKRN